jgi:hypothetical protein
VEQLGHFWLTYLRFVLWAQQLVLLLLADLRQLVLWVLKLQLVLSLSVSVNRALLQLSWHQAWCWSK